MGPHEMSETTIQPTALPTGTATFVFTDIEGSTKLVQQIGTERWRQVLEDHHRLLREQWQAFDGREVNTEGDAFFVAFPSATNALRPRAARIAWAGHGGQVLVSESTRSLVAGALPDQVTLLDLGEHRLKDLIRAEHIYQLVLPGLPSEFPPLKSLDATPNNLPTQMTTFVGRDEEVASAHELLHTVRLLTLTGPGGTGNTRLSVQIAADIAGECHGVYFVPLASIDDAELVPTTIARALGLQESGQKTPVEMIIENLGSTKVLLVLDNFEQLILAAPSCGQILLAPPQVNV